MPTIYVLSKNKKNIKKFHLKIIIFTALKYCNILHGHVCVMSFSVLQLVLRENDLIAIPKEIGDLSRLRELLIQGNRLTVLPPEIGNYP